MVNTQGVYKAKIIKKDTEQYSKAGIFSDLLSKNRGWDYLELRARIPSTKW
jgi:hypothetical protein